MEFHKIDNIAVGGPRARLGFIDVPLSILREVNSNDIPAIHDTPLTADPAGFAGWLAKNTTPILEWTNGDTDSSLRVSWVADDVAAVSFQVVLPPDIDTNDPVEIHLYGEVAGSTPWDSTAIASDVFFNIGDTKVEDTVSFTDGTVTDKTISIAAADVPADARVMSVELTPGAHANDAFYLYGVWIEYTKLP